MGEGKEVRGTKVVVFFGGDTWKRNLSQCFSSCPGTSDFELEWLGFGDVLGLIRFLSRELEANGHKRSKWYSKCRERGETEFTACAGLQT